MKLRSVLLLAALLMLVAVPIAQATVQFSHPYDAASTNAFSSFYTDPNTGMHQSFADYYWDGSFSITDFHWWGAPRNDNADIEGFMFQIYDQGAGPSLPGSLLYQQYVAGDNNATWVDHNDQYGDDIYSYWMDLTSPFTPAVSGHYWFSVYAISDGDLNNWFWALGAGDPFQEDWVLESMTNWWNLSEWDPYVTGGFAYEITGEDTIPEPGTLVLFGIGLVGMAVRRFRRK